MFRVGRVRGDRPVAPTNYFSWIALLQPPLGDFDAPGEPHFGKALRILNELVDDLGAEWNPRNERMEIKRKVLRRPLFTFPVEIVELILHDLQQIARRAASP